MSNSELIMLMEGTHIGDDPQQFMVIINMYDHPLPSLVQTQQGLEYN